MENQTQIIKSLIEAMLDKLSVSGEIEILENSEGAQFIVKTKEAGLLIGEGGQNLLAFSHLLKKIADNEFKKNNMERIQFFLDINGYQAKRIE